MNLLEIVIILLEKGSDINATDIIGRTPLYFSLQNHYI